MSLTLMDGKCFILVECNVAKRGMSWQNVLSVRKKSALQRRLGRWLEEKTRAAKEWSSRSDSLNAAENLSDLSWAREKSSQ
jgi:hypothetical protein